MQQEPSIIKLEAHRQIVHDLRNALNAALGLMEYFYSGHGAEEDYPPIPPFGGDDRQFLEAIRMVSEMVDPAIEVFSAPNAQDSAHPNSDVKVEEVLYELKRIRRLLDAIIGRFSGEEESHSYFPFAIFSSIFSGLKLQYTNIDFLLEDPYNLSLCTQRSALERVIENLLKNSARAIAEKSISFDMRGKITLSIAPAQDRNSIFISVQDNGCGIPLDKLQQATRISFTTKVEEKGVEHGIGLLNIREIVESLGGTIKIESVHTDQAAEASYTNITLVLPYAEEQGRAPQPLYQS